jgi:hypothetical protein
MTQKLILPSRSSPFPLPHREEPSQNESPKFQGTRKLRLQVIGILSTKFGRVRKLFVDVTLAPILNAYRFRRSISSFLFPHNLSTNLEQGESLECMVSATNEDLTLGAFFNVVRKG